MLVFFLVVGLRSLFAIPAEPSANWVFKLSDAEDARLHVRGAAAAMVSLGVLPVIVLLLPLHLFTLGMSVTAFHSVLLLAAGCLLAEIVLTRFKRVPFTSAYDAPAARARVMWPFWLVGYLVFSFTLSSLEGVLLDRPLGAVGLVAGVAAAAAVVRLFRERKFHVGARTLTFDGGEEDAPVTLQLSGIVPLSAPRS